MNKEEAIEKLRRAESDLRQAEIVMEMHENGVRELREDIGKLKAIINKKDDWKSVEVPDEWHHLYLEKITLMADMMRFAYIRNEGWMPDWGNGGQVKHGIVQKGNGVEVDWFTHANSFVFGVTVKYMAIAEEMLEIFGKRIEKFYNKQY